MKDYPDEIIDKETKISDPKPSFNAAEYMRDFNSNPFAKQYKMIVVNESMLWTLYLILFFIIFGIVVTMGLYDFHMLGGVMAQLCK